jgi:regulatory protein
VTSDPAFEEAARALRHRDRTAAQLERHLAERGFDEAERAAALDTLARTGIVDDARYAENRAATLAERGAGDALIRHELGVAGVPADDIERALEALDSECDRAERIVDRRGASAKTARYLGGKGFSDDTIDAVIARVGDEALG